MIEFFARVAHCEGQGAGFVEREAAQPGGHEPCGELFERDSARGRAGDQEADFARVERAAIALFADQVDGVEGRRIVGLMHGEGLAVISVSSRKPAAVSLKRALFVVHPRQGRLPGSQAG